MGFDSFYLHATILHNQSLEVKEVKGKNTIS
jgi:hypothetical protein